MRTVVENLEVASVASWLPAAGETSRVALTGSGSRGVGQHLDLPAFGTDPRLHPALPASLRRRIDRFTAVGYLAVSAALEGLPEGQRPERERIGVFLTNTRAGWSYGTPELALLVERGPQAMHAYQATAWFPAAAQGEVTIGLDLRGCAKTTAGHDSGFAEAIWLARDALERDAIDLALVGAVESLTNGFVLRDWADDEPLPSSGPAEGAVVFALRRPTAAGTTRLENLRHVQRPEQRDGSWVPTLSAAARLHAGVTDAADAEDAAVRGERRTAVTLGGGFEITIHHPVATTEQENR